MTGLGFLEASYFRADTEVIIKRLTTHVIDSVKKCNGVNSITEASLLSFLPGLISHCIMIASLQIGTLCPDIFT